MARLHIAVIGNVGAGKETVVRRVSEALAISAGLEDFDQNPYLEDFYRNPAKWALPSELWFLADIAGKHSDIASCEWPVIQEQTIYTIVEVFCVHLGRTGALDDTQLRLVCRLYRLLKEALPPPDLLIYLHADLDDLEERIRARGRPMELGLSRCDLRCLQELFDQFAARWARSRLMRINTTVTDVRTERGLQFVTDAIHPLLPS
jgi:deoxyadenosine/deoxycytidine kinase